MDNSMETNNTACLVFPGSWLLSQLKVFILCLKNIKILMKPLGLFINERKTHIFKLCKTFTFLQNKYHLTNTGKLIKRPCNRKIVDIRRKLKSLYIKVMNKELNSESLISLYKSWTGNYFKDMSKLQIYRMKLLYESMCTNLVYTN